ncbi:hypothetical protein [Lysinibacillus xylanilyticus]|uniref:hypothetical protein n=1 Tax=Lysinibacillus xylanilyticus TaxID=582475 RepID=UPI003814AB91
MTYSNSLIFSINTINAAVVGTVSGVIAYREIRRAVRGVIGGELLSFLTTI